MRRWRIYYDDGSAFGDTEGRPEDAPSFGVIAIAQTGDPEDYHGPNRETQSRWDWYFWEHERREWWGCDLQGLLDRLLHNLPTSAVKQGRSVPNTLFREIMYRATQDELG